MIKTPLSTVIGGAFWTPGATILGSSSKNLTQLIKSLFSVGGQGFAYDPNDLTTLYQDAAGTIPVTTAGQPVGLMKDKSGRNNHAYQSVSASRPILQRNATTGAYYLVFDGVDDFLQTNSIDFTTTNKMSLFAGVRKLSDSGAAVITELSPNTPTSAGSFSIFAPHLNGAATYGGTLNGVSARNFNVAGYPAPRSDILTAKFDVSQASIAAAIKLSLNASNVTYAGDSAWGSSTSFGNHPLYIGRRAGTSLPFNGHLYSLIGIGRLTTDSETVALEKAIAKNTGVTLNA